jgi:hypothetical protein
MTIYLRRGLEFRDSDLAITGEALLKQVVQRHMLTVHDSDIRVVRVRQNGTLFNNSTVGYYYNLATCSMIIMSSFPLPCTRCCDLLYLINAFIIITRTGIYP